MKTIQVRDIPEDAYETIRRRATAAGQSLQSYMRDRVIDMAHRRTKAEVIHELQESLRRFGGAGASLEEIVADVQADRR